MRLCAAGLLVGTLGLMLLPVLPSANYWLLSPLIFLPLVKNRGWTQFVAAAALGFFWSFWLVSEQLSTELSEQLAGQDLELVGKIHSLPRIGEGGDVRFDFSVVGMISPQSPQLAGGVVRLTWYHRESAPRVIPKAGELWRLTVRLKPRRGLANPSAFDYEQYLFRQQIVASGYIRDKARNQRLREASGPASWRQKLYDHLLDVLPESSDRAYLSAVILGESHELNPQQWRWLRDTGTAHLMAISGLHIGLVAGLVFFLVRRLVCLFPSLLKRMPDQKWAAIAAIAAAAGYATLAGFSIPTQRALIMVLVAFLSIVIQRHQLPSRTLSIALVAVLLWNPLSVLSPGFYLSFIAVAILLYCLTGRRNLLSGWRLWLYPQLALSATLVPLTIVFFGQASLISPFANLLAIPLVALLLIPLSLVAMLLSLVVPFIGDPLLSLASDGFWLVEWLLRGLASLDWAAIRVVRPPPWTWFFAIIAVLLALAPRGIPARHLSIFLLLPFFLHRSPTPAFGEFSFTLLDVGQGLAAVVQTEQHLLLFDTGTRYRSGFNMGDAVVVPYLIGSGISRINKLVISHDDLDHRGGAVAVMAVLPVDEVVASSVRGPGFVARTLCQSGDRWNWDGVAFRFLHPGGEENLHSDNDRSCVLKVENGSGSLLLTGDIEQKAEAVLVEKQGDWLNSTVVTVPHHGSKTSSTEGFVQSVNPAYALLAVGYRNRFDFPHHSVVSRYQQQGSRLMSSVTSGAIGFYFPATGVVAEPSQFRLDHPRIWRR